MTLDPDRRESTGGWSRRRLLGAAAAAVGLGATAGCSSVASGLTAARDTGTLDYWNLFGGGDGVRMQQMLDAFQQEHPGIELAAVTLAWGNPYYTKLSLATLGDRPPEVAISHLTRMKNLVRADLLEELRPEDLARHGMTPDKFNQRAWEAGLVDGKAYAIPIDTHPFVMFYNTDICQEAGLLDAGGKLKPIDSPEAFVDAMRKAKEVTGTVGGVVAFVSETSTPWRMFQSFYSQLGGQMLADDGTRVVIDDAKATQVLEFMQALTRDGLFPNPIDYQGSIAMFANGDAGFFFQGEWEITTFQTAKLPFSMTLFPNVFGGGNYAVQADSHTFVLPRQPHRDQARIDRSLTFVRSMLDQSKTWTEGGHVPLWLPFAQSSEFAQMTPQSNYASAADAAAYDAEGWYSGSGSNFEIITGSAIGDVLAGASTPQQAIAQMRGSLEQLAATASPL
ncbi:extracellular solute-binding protein [Asanoa sp. WMMD1127]|uniref:extracellular solute-binding protein n=1 Tax=Asanoa sp. WMMD1127 TaxID=3016107 RepID=UPI0024169FA1|nr:extracellular solute-binding protein [Asanoa sp. WMMD1127]MDG4825655.1 extracellular solute-binding protein [Asanoa sp. WMMD1127]